MPKEKEFSFEPEYAVEGGVEHEFNGTLLVPTPEEIERLEGERVLREAASKIVVGLSCTTPVKGVQMNPFDAMRLRSKP